MLHIQTPLYRFENLELIYNSIPMNDDITWHITKSSKREDLNFDFIKNDTRIKVYNVDCEDDEIYKKRNAVFKNIKDGYFCLLDDDTIFHENMYFTYKELEEKYFTGMLIGQQVDFENDLRLDSFLPAYSQIDAGNVIADYTCLSSCEWPSSNIIHVNAKDQLFWECVYNFYRKKTKQVKYPISIYNKLNHERNGKKKKGQRFF